MFAVFRSKYSEMDWVVKRSGRGNESGFEQGDSNGPGDESVVRLRGLPFDSTKMDIVKFFDGTSFRERELRSICQINRVHLRSFLVYLLSRSNPL